MRSAIPTCLCRSISISYISAQHRYLSADFSLSELREGEIVPCLLHNIATLLLWIILIKFDSDSNSVLLTKLFFSVMECISSVISI